MLATGIERAQQALFEREIHSHLALRSANFQQLLYGFQGQILPVLELFDDVEYKQVLVIVVGNAALHYGRWKQSLCVVKTNGAARQSRKVRQFIDGMHSACRPISLLLCRLHCNTRTVTMPAMPPPSATTCHRSRVS